MCEIFLFAMKSSDSNKKGALVGVGGKGEKESPKAYG